MDDTETTFNFFDDAPNISDMAGNMNNANVAQPPPAVNRSVPGRRDRATSEEITPPPTLTDRQFRQLLNAITDTANNVKQLLNTNQHGTTF